MCVTYSYRQAMREVFFSSYSPVVHNLNAAGSCCRFSAVVLLFRSINLSVSLLQGRLLGMPQMSEASRRAHESRRAGHFFRTQGLRAMHRTSRIAMHLANQRFDYNARRGAPNPTRYHTDNMHYRWLVMERRRERRRSLISRRRFHRSGVFRRHAPTSGVPGRHFPQNVRNLIASYL